MEYKLYYGPAGEVITYTTETLEGNWIQITREQFAEARMDIKVVDGRISVTSYSKLVRKLVKNNLNGIKTSKYDVNVLSDVDCVQWSITVNELPR